MENSSNFINRFRWEPRLHGFCFDSFPARPTATEVTITAVVAAAGGGGTRRGEVLVGAEEVVGVAAAAEVGVIRRKP